MFSKIKKKYINKKIDFLLNVFFFLLGQTRTRCLWWSVCLKVLFSLFLPIEPVKHIRNLKFEILREMATASSNMKGFYRQKKNKNSGITKPTSSKKSSLHHIASLGSDITQLPARISHGSPDHKGFCFICTLSKFYFIFLLHLICYFLFDYWCIFFSIMKMVDFFLFQENNFPCF